MSTFKEKLARASLARRTVDICLAGGLVAEFEQLERELEEAQRSSAGDSLEDSTAALEIAQRMEALREQMQEATHTFVLQALPGPRYRALKAQHPPRESDDGGVREEDRYLDANLDTFVEPLLRACLVEPELTDAEWSEVSGVLSQRQYNDLAGQAIYVNTGSVSVPFSRAASAILTSSEPG